MEVKDKKHYKKMYVPWFPVEDTEADFVGYIHHGLHHEIGEEVEFPDSEWSYMHESPTPFEKKEMDDSSMHFKVLDAFYSNKEIDASRINVLVHNGIINLSGVVLSVREKNIAEEIARNIPEVWNVENELEVLTENVTPKYFFH